MSFIESVVNETDSLQGFEVSPEENEFCSQIMMRRGDVEVSIFYDWRVHCPEVEIGLAENQSMQGGQIPVWLIAKWLNLSWQEFEPKGEVDAALDQIRYEIDWMTQNAIDLLGGHRQRFERLQEFFNGYNAAYTDYCSGEFDSE